MVKTEVMYSQNASDLLEVGGIFIDTNNSNKIPIWKDTIIHTALTIPLSSNTSSLICNYQYM